MRVYVDGVLDGTNILPAGYSLSDASQQNAYVGVIADNTDSSLYKYFVGLINEVCVFACALDADSVKAPYSGRLIEQPSVALQIEIRLISKLSAFLGHDPVGSLQQRQDRIWHTIGGNKIRTSDLDGIVEDVSWRQHLSDKDLETIFHIAGKEAVTLGY